MLIYISAGEHSGDMHAATLARELLARQPGLELIGMGGPCMSQAGVRVLFDPTSRSTLGFVEALKNLGAYRRLLRQVLDLLAERRPQAVVWVDFGGFNLALAKGCKELGIPVVCVFSPSAWAYGSKRARLMAERVSELASVLPFEAEFYASFGLKTSFVGHPLLDLVRPSMPPDRFRREIGLGQEQVVGILPGSRRQEIARLLPVMLAAAGLIKEKFPATRFLLPRAPSIPMPALQEHLDRARLPVRVTDGRAYDVLSVSTAAMVASGTATLEAAIIGTPMVSVYRISGLSLLIYKMLRNPADRGKDISTALPNLVLGRRAVPELLQRELTPARLAGEIERILLDEPYRERMRQDLRAARAALGEPGAMGRVAEIVLRTARAGG